MKIKLGLLALVTIFLFGCSQSAFDESIEQEENQEILSSDMPSGKIVSRSGQRTSEAVMLFIDNHIVVDGYLFKVSLDKSEAMKLGVTGEEYDEICRNIEAGNRMAEESIQLYYQGERKSVKIIDGRTNVTIYELGDNNGKSCQEYEIPMLKSGTEPTSWPYGVLRTGGYESESSASFPIEFGMRGINCTFTTDAGLGGTHRLNWLINGRWSDIVAYGNSAEQIYLSGSEGYICYLRYETSGCTGRCNWVVY